MQYGIFRPDGQQIGGFDRETRKAARQGFAGWHGVKWGSLWKRGYRCRMVVETEAYFSQEEINRRRAAGLAELSAGTLGLMKRSKGADVEEPKDRLEALFNKPEPPHRRTLAEWWEGEYREPTLEEVLGEAPEKPLFVKPWLRRVLEWALRLLSKSWKLLGAATALGLTFWALKGLILKNPSAPYVTGYLLFFGVLSFVYGWLGHEDLDKRKNGADKDRE